jgi:hypothetical protein
MILTVDLKREAEDIALDCEDCAADAEKDGDDGLRRAWLAVAYRVRRLKRAADHDIEQHKMRC